jgi:hypothetical protein
MIERAAFSTDYAKSPSQRHSAKEKREAILSFLSCLEAVLWMIEFVDDMLRGCLSHRQKQFLHMNQRPCRGYAANSLQEGN